MPSIPEYFATQFPDLGSPGREAARAIRENINSAGFALGRGADAVMNEVHQANQQHDALDALDSIQKDYFTARDDLMGRISSAADPSDPKIYNDWRGEWSEKIGQTADKMRTSEGRARYQQQAMESLFGLEKEGYALQQQLIGQKAESALKDNALPYANDSILHPENTSANASNAMAGVDMLAAAFPKAFPKETLDAEKFNQAQQVYEAGAVGSIQRAAANPNLGPADVAALRDQFTRPDSPYKKYMTPARYAAALEDIDRLGSRQSDLMMRQAEQQIPDLIKAAREGNQDALDTLSGFRAIPGKTADDTALWQSKIDRLVTEAKSYRDQTKVVDDMPADQFPAAIAAAKMAVANAKTADERTAAIASQNALISRIKSREQEFHADPAIYAVAHDKATAARFDAFQKSPSPKTFADYADATSNYQATLHPEPGFVPKLLMAPIADDIGKTIAALGNDPKNVGAAFAKLDSWRQIAGGRWMEVAHELQNAKVLNSDQFVASMLLPDPKASVLVHQLLSASVMPSSNLSALGGISSGAATQAATAALQPLRESLGNTWRDGGRVYSAYTSAISHLVQLTAPSGATQEQLQDIATNAANTMLNDSYAFRGRNGSTTLRIPLMDRNGKPTGYDPDVIQAGTERVLSHIDSLDIVAPPSLSGLNAADQKSVYADRLRHDGVWFATGDGKGATLYDGAAAGAAVMERRGGKIVPLTRTWEELGREQPEQPTISVHTY